MKRYTLYLDESGDFDEDLNIEWKNECLVGGLLVENEFDFKAARAILSDTYRKVVPDGAAASDEAAIDAIRHATEIRDYKAELQKRVLDETSRHGSFVIFENYAKTRIIDSTTIYINILADGIMQLLTDLIYDNNGDAVEIEAVIGIRKDTAKRKELDIDAVIEKEEYERRLKERLALERVKRHNVFSSKSDVKIRMESDKKDYFLILCDYICNSYITRTAKIYDEVCENGRTYRDNILSLYSEDRMYQLNGNIEKDKVHMYIDSQAYGIALFDICSEVIKESRNIERIVCEG